MHLAGQAKATTPLRSLLCTPWRTPFSYGARYLARTSRVCGLGELHCMRLGKLGAVTGPTGPFGIWMRWRRWKVFSPGIKCLQAFGIGRVCRPTPPTGCTPTCQSLQGDKTMIGRTGQQGVPCRAAEGRNARGKATRSLHEAR